jgi:hypothetical protein
MLLLTLDLAVRCTGCTRALPKLVQTLYAVTAGAGYLIQEHEQAKVKYQAKQGKPSNTSIQPLALYSLLLPH